jgi:hypothetical protein
MGVAGPGEARLQPATGLKSFLTRSSDIAELNARAGNWLPMTAPTAGDAIDAAMASPAAPSGSIPNINASTGLSTDYLNHFTEAVMAIEMIASMPECLDDLRAWQPRSYVEHFAESRFTHRGAVIAAYRSANAATREALDTASSALNASIQQIRDAVLAGGSSGQADTLAQGACEAIRPKIAGMAALINGTTSVGCQGGSTQSEIDAMFGR